MESMLAHSVSISVVGGGQLEKGRRHSLPSVKGSVMGREKRRGGKHEWPINGVDVAMGEL